MLVISESKESRKNWLRYEQMPLWAPAESHCKVKLNTNPSLCFFFVVYLWQL